MCNELLRLGTICPQPRVRGVALGSLAGRIRLRRSTRRVVCFFRWLQAVFLQVVDLEDTGSCFFCFYRGQFNPLLFPHQLKELTDHILRGYGKPHAFRLLSHDWKRLGILLVVGERISNSFQHYAIQLRSSTAVARRARKSSLLVTGVTIRGSIRNHTT